MSRPEKHSFLHKVIVVSQLMIVIVFWDYIFFTPTMSVAAVISVMLATQSHLHAADDTMSCVAVSVRGRVKEIGSGLLPVLFEKNPYMLEIYPTEDSRKALTVFQLYEGGGEWFDLSKKPIERDSFSFGGAERKASGYFVTDACIGCGACQNDCPQSCIDMIDGKAVIRQQNCLHCGNCAAVCPVGAVIVR